MKKRGSITAGELNERLAKDAEYQARLAAQDAHAELIRRQEEPLLEELRYVGATADSLEDMVKKYAPLPAEISSVLLGYLDAPLAPGLIEAIVRALGAAGEPFDPSPLRDLFESTQSDLLRWAIANTLAELRPLGLRDWLAATIVKSELGTSRQMLTLAVARTFPAREACDLLMQVYADLPGHVALALGECGEEKELEFLRSEVTKVPRGWIKAEIEKSIKRIQRRVDKVKGPRPEKPRSHRRRQGNSD